MYCSLSYNFSGYHVSSIAIRKTIGGKVSFEKWVYISPPKKITVSIKIMMNRDLVELIKYLNLDHI
jgi:hypothetical protein